MHARPVLDSASRMSRQKPKKNYSVEIWAFTDLGPIRR